MRFFHSALSPLCLWREFPRSPRVPPQQPCLGRHQQPGGTREKCHLMCGDPVVLALCSCLSCSPLVNSMGLAPAQPLALLVLKEFLS